MEFFDSHCHLDMEKFDADRNEVICRALEAGVSRMLAVASAVESFEKTLSLARNHKEIFAAIGISPFESEIWPEIKLDFRKQAEHEDVIAIGECGLDYYWDIASPSIQKHCFESQLSIAAEVDKPVIIHCRDAWDDMKQIVEACKNIYKDKLRGILHCFTGNHGDAKFFTKRGFLISFAGNVTYKKSQNIRDALDEISTSDILIETDAPFLSPQELRGKRNEPANVVKTATFISEHLGIPLEEFALASTANACRLFRLPMGNDL